MVRPYESRNDNDEAVAVGICLWIAVVLWSLFAWGAYGLLDVFGDLAVRNADMVSDHPETVEWLSWSLAALRSLGLGPSFSSGLQCPC